MCASQFREFIGLGTRGTSVPLSGNVGRWYGAAGRNSIRNGRPNDYSFSSFEWYPFDDVCKPTGPQLKQSTGLFSRLLTAMRKSDRHGVRWIMTEYGYSVFGGRPEIDIEAALFNADAVADFLSLGGEQTFLYGYEPNHAGTSG